jgi:glycosyltransferase involved in cell wall biosynthesis
LKVGSFSVIELGAVLAQRQEASVDEEKSPPGFCPPSGDFVPPSRPLTILLIAPTVEAGAADSNVVDIAGILARAGHHPIVVSCGGRKAVDLGRLGAEWVALDVASVNPVVMLANVRRLERLIRERSCDIVHAHGRAAAWSGRYAARLTQRPFVTTWYKGFREQNLFKRLYNGVMVHADCVVAVTDQIAELIHDRYRTPWERLTVLPTGIDATRFDPASVLPARVTAMRRSWGVGERDKVILVVGRMLRRKGHHVVVEAVRKLKEVGLKDFVCVFASEESGTRYATEIWDRVLGSETSDVVRLVGSLDDVPAAYAAATVLVSAAVQPEGLQRAVLEAQAMARPVIVSDLGAGPEVVLSPPSVPEDRMTGLRFPAGDAAALATAVVRLFSLPEAARSAVGARGREWVVANFDPVVVAAQTLALYEGLARPPKQ